MRIFTQLLVSLLATESTSRQLNTRATPLHVAADIDNDCHCRLSLYTVAYRLSRYIDYRRKLGSVSCVADIPRRILENTAPLCGHCFTEVHRKFLKYNLYRIYALRSILNYSEH